MRRFVWLFGLVLAFSLAAAAQDTSKADVFLGYSYGRIMPRSSGASNFNINGGTGSIAWNLNDFFGIVADFAGYRVGKINGLDLDSNAFTYLFGPRLSYRSRKKVTPFAQVLFGGAHVSSPFLGAADSKNAFAMTAGGGLDLKASSHVAFRLVQAEYFLTRFREPSGIACALIFPAPPGCPPAPSRKTQNNLRFSTGIVFRF